MCIYKFIYIYIYIHNHKHTHIHTPHTLTYMLTYDTINIQIQVLDNITRYYSLEIITNRIFHICHISYYIGWYELYNQL